MSQYHVEKNLLSLGYLILDASNVIMLVIENERDADYLCQLFNRGTLVLVPQQEETS